MNSFKRFAKRFLVWFIAVVMLAAMAPAAVFADTSEADTDNPETEIVQEASDNAERADEQEQTDASGIKDPTEKEENIPAEREPEGKTEVHSAHRDALLSAEEPANDEPAKDAIITFQPKAETVSQEAKNAVSYPTLTLGRTKTVTSDEDTAVYKYRPSETAEYIISSFNQGEHDPNVECFLDDELSECEDSDDDGGEDGNFKLRLTLTAGTTYYFVFGACEGGPFSYSVLLKKVEETTVTFYTGRDTEEAWFYADGFTSKRNFAKETYEIGESILQDSLVPGCIDSLLFLGWSVNPDATEPDEDIIASAGLKVYAVWKSSAVLTINEETALTDEDGSTFYGFQSQSLTTTQRYEVTVQLQNDETELEAKLYRYYFASQEYHWALEGSYSGQGSTIKWILPRLLSGEDYYLEFKNGESGAVLNGSVLLKAITTASVTFNVNNSNAYYVTQQDGEEIHDSKRIETLAEGTVIQDTALGTSILVPTAPSNLRFLGWATNKSATVPDSEIILGTTNKTVYGVWKTIEEHTHTPGEAVRENEVAATCKEAGSYDEVIYCTVCEEELSRTAKAIPKSTIHTPGEAVRENEVAATCKDAGSYDEVVYCTVCEAELSRTPKTIPESTTHTLRKEETKAATLEKTGIKEHWICTVCGLHFADKEGKEQLNLGDVTVPKLINVEEAMVSVSEAVYTGESLTPDVKVTLLDKTLRNDTDYTLEYRGNINAGKGMVTVHGIGLYGGVKEVEYTIEKAPTMVRLNGKTVAYNGKPVSINPAVVKGSSGKITYTYYSDAACRKVIAMPKNAGIYYAKATVAADANYKGASAVAKLTITPVTPKIKVTPLKTTAAKLKKKAQVLGGAIRISSPPGKATYTRVKKGSSKNLLINSKTGKITVKKGTKKGKYSIIVNVKVPKSPNSKALVKKVKVTVNVK